MSRAHTVANKKRALARRPLVEHKRAMRAEVRKRLAAWLEGVGTEPPHDAPLEVAAAWGPEVHRIASRIRKSAV